MQKRNAQCFSPIQDAIKNPNFTPHATSEDTRWRRYLHSLPGLMLATSSLLQSSFTPFTCCLPQQHYHDLVTLLYFCNPLAAGVASTISHVNLIFLLPLHCCVNFEVHHFIRTHCNHIQLILYNNKIIRNFFHYFLLLLFTPTLKRITLHF